MTIKNKAKFAKISVLSKEEEFSLIQILNRKFAVFLNGRFFSLNLNVNEQSAYITVTLQSNDGEYFYPVEARVAYKDQDATAKDSVLIILDYIDIYFDEYFKNNEEVYLPLDWSGYKFEELEFDLKAQVKNKKVESLADALIAGDLSPKDL